MKKRRKKRRLDARPCSAKKALAYAKKIEGNRQLAIKFLKKAGFIEKT